MSDAKADIKSIFGHAMGLSSSEERAAYLQQACGGDLALQAEIESLLRAGLEAGSFLGEREPCLVATVDDPISERPGTVIGPYKLMEQIGEGGMGLVFVAEQQQPVRRKVALKVIKPGMDTRHVVARFEAERQALALMDHPNIAKVLDGGETAGGRPYFVMELVKGMPITEYCDLNKVPIRDRLELFVSVCQAVQHAHQKGIIHRDIKPSNVLITLHDGTPVVKVIDFGVAKAIGQQLTDKTIYTQFNQMVGTPLYMSPEQAWQSGLDVDTRSDIYSLGVLLYELLTGTTPFDKERMRELSYDEMRRIIREEEPPKPSTRISTLGKAATTLSTQRQSEPKQLRRLIRGELDWIVMKALEKDRNRRYETASAFASDVNHYLHDEPVQACPPSTIYRLRKFARKYRMLLRITGVFVVFLVLATAVSTWLAMRANRERERAEKSFRMARDAVDQLFTQVSQSPTLKTQALDKFRKDLLRKAKEFYERFIREQFDDPGVRGDLGLAYQRLGVIDRELGNYAAAGESLTKAVELLDELARAQPDVPEYPRDLAASYAALGLVYSDSARFKEAEAAFEQALAIQKKQAEAYPQASEYRYALAKTYRDFGTMYPRVDHGDSEGAKRYQQALDVLSKLVQDDPRDEHQWLLATTQMDLGLVYLAKGWHDKGETALKEAQGVYESLIRDRADVPPEYWHYLARSYLLLGMAYRGQARAEMVEAAQGQRRQSNPKPGQALLEKAETAQGKAVEIFEKLAKEHPDVQEHTYGVGRSYREWARVADSAGRLDVALDRYDKAIGILGDVMAKGYHHARIQLLDARIGRAATLTGRGDHVRAAAEAESVAQQGELLSLHLYNIACVFSRASAAVDRDGKLSPADRTRLKAHYADRAMDLLRQAIAKGYRHLQVIKNDPDMEPLRAREDFRKLLADLEAKNKE